MVWLFLAALLGVIGTLAVVGAISFVKQRVSERRAENRNASLPTRE
jgi:hypothetical protein